MCSVLADTSTQTRLFLWDESERKGKSIQDFDCNDPVSWMEGSSSGRSKWIPCHSSLITPASLLPSSFLLLHTPFITSSVPFLSLCQAPRGPHSPRQAAVVDWAPYASVAVDAEGVCHFGGQRARWDWFGWPSLWGSWKNTKVEEASGCRKPENLSKGILTLQSLLNSIDNQKASSAKSYAS